MDLAKRAELELERRKQNKARKRSGEPSLRTVDGEMSVLGGSDLRLIAAGEKVDLAEARQRMQDKRTKPIVAKTKG